MRIRLLRHAGEKGDGYAVATAVIVGDGVHRLVQIADEMYDEAEGVGSSLSGRVRILKDAKLRGEGGCEAAVDGRAIASEAAAARAARTSPAANMISTCAGSNRARATRPSLTLRVL